MKYIVKQILLLLLLLFLFAASSNQSNSVSLQGMDIENGKMTYFNPSEYCFRYMVVSARGLKGDKANKYLPNASIAWLAYDVNEIWIFGGTYNKNNFVFADIFVPNKPRTKVFFKQDGDTKIAVSKDKKKWEPLIIKFRTIDNQCDIGMLEDAYQCTVYFSCSFFSGEYDVFDDVQGIKMQKGKITVFKPEEYWAGELILNEQYNYKNRQDNRISNGIIDLKNYSKKNDLKIVLFDTKSWDVTQTYDYEKYFTIIYYRQEQENVIYVSKDKENWEQLYVSYYGNKNCWKDYEYRWFDYRYTIELKCSLFEGLYDVFYFAGEPG